MFDHKGKVKNSTGKALRIWTKTEESCFERFCDNPEIF